MDANSAALSRRCDEPTTFEPEAVPEQARAVTLSWRVARSLLTLFDQFNHHYPDRSRVSDGTIGDASHQKTDSDHNPWYPPPGGGIVTAGDFTHDPAHGMDIDRLTDELVATRDPRIKYIIANNLILDTRPQFNPWQWMPYHGSNPHDHHFHLSVMDSPLCDDPRPWTLASFGGAPPHQSIGEMMSQGTLPPCDVGRDGTLFTRRAYWCVTTGRASSLTKRSWLGLSTGWDDAPEVRVWFLGTNPDGTPNYDLPAPPSGAPPFPGNGKPFALKKNARQWWEAPDGTDQIAVEYLSTQPLGWEIEKEPR
jgi:hypothetical protein